MLRIFDIENLPIVFDDEYIFYPSTSSQNSNTNDNIIPSSNNMSNDPNIVQNIVNVNPEKKTKHQFLKKTLSFVDTHLFSGHWNFNENLLGIFV